LVATTSVTSLLDLHRHPHQRGGHGVNGMGSNRTGADGDDLDLLVPIGTVVRDGLDGRVLADLPVPGARAVIARGGRGGRGNAAFASAHRRVPTFAERGEPGEERRLRLELRLVADAGLVGFPSAGKSSLIARLSAARPKVAAYPFTTLVPNLGVMRAGDVDVVLADVPGLIEGASEGRGLGHRFLRHVERCLVLVHVVDLAPLETDRDPLTDLAVVRAELQAHEPALLERPQLVVLNKLDLPESRELAELVLPELEATGEDVYLVSAVSGEGLDALRWRIAAVVAAARTDEVHTFVPTERIVRLDEDERRVTVGRDDAGDYVVTGPGVERWVRMTPLDNTEALRYLQGRLRRAGVERALVAAGARAGDEAIIAGWRFEFDPELNDLPPDERAAVLAAEAEADVRGDEAVDG